MLLMSIPSSAAIGSTAISCIIYEAGYSLLVEVKGILLK